MLTENLNPSRGLANGSPGVFHSLGVFHSFGWTNDTVPKQLTEALKSNGYQVVDLDGPQKSSTLSSAGRTTGTV